ncbi:MAG TPA: DUF3237 family protein, partial [Acidimicrobiales bacterium]|nr:DUF3237 family protein [Acidimicrobiales bacterium]
MPDQWPHLELRDLLSIEVFVRPVVDLGGGRRFVAFDGGTFEGARDEVAGTILEGGIDWQRVREDGVLEIDAHYTLLSDLDEAVEVLARPAPGGARGGRAHRPRRPCRSRRVLLPDPRPLFDGSAPARPPERPAGRLDGSAGPVGGTSRRLRGPMKRAGGGGGGKPRCVVVGAGIGGLASALSLHEVSAEVEVFDSVRRVSALGVGINLLPHAVRELDAMDLLERLDARGVTPTRLLYCTRRGQEIWQEPRGVAAGYPWPQLSIHRGVLQEVLLDALVDRLGAGALQLGRRLVRIDDDGGGGGSRAARGLR